MMKLQKVWNKKLFAAMLGAGLLFSPCVGRAISVADVTGRSAGVNVGSLANGVDITSTAQNNVVNWSSYNVGRDQTVQYDAHNYLNLIGGNGPSQIDGTLIGDGNIYLINPNGVLFGDGCTVNVGNLYVSSNTLTAKAISDFEDNGTNPLAGSVANGGDIVNLGKIYANSVYFEGNNVTLTTESVKDVEAAVVRAQGEINVCFADGEDAVKVNNDQFKNEPDIKNITNVEWQDLAGYERNDVTSYWQIRNVYELQNMKNNLSANYALVTDIDAITTERWNDGAGFQPVGTTTAFEEYNSAYTGKFDGLNHKINGLSINRPTKDYVGLFGFTHNAEVKNLSISGQIIGNLYVGSIAGYNDAGTIKNVTNEGNVKGMYVGGLAGLNSNGTVIGVNKGNVMGEALLWEYVRDEFGHVILDDYGTAMYFEKVSRADYVGGLVGYSGRRSSEMGPELGVVTGTNFGKVAGNNFVGGLVGSNEAKVTGQNMGTVKGYGAFSGDLVGENFGTVNGTDANFKNIFEDIDIILNGVEAIGLNRVLKVFSVAEDYQRLNLDTILLQPGLNINLAGQVIAGNTLPLVQFEKDEE